jgi:Uma2 family endonuclease
MNAVATTPKATITDLLAARDSNALELVNGVLVEKKVGVLSSVVEGLIYALILAHAKSSNAGWVWPGTLGYKCFPSDADKVRKPDVSFVRANRWSAEFLRVGFMTVRPDLAVEVISPNDLSDEVAEKVDEYAEAGVPLVWVVHPVRRTVHVYRGDGTVTKLQGTAEITGEDVLPGFRCPIAAFFPAETASSL